MSTLESLTILREGDKIKVGCNMYICKILVNKNVNKTKKKTKKQPIIINDNNINNKKIKKKKKKKKKTIIINDNNKNNKKIN